MGTHTHALTTHLFIQKPGLVQLPASERAVPEEEVSNQGDAEQRGCCRGLKFTALRIHLLPLLLTHYKGWRMPVTYHRGTLRSSRSIIGVKMWALRCFPWFYSSLSTTRGWGMSRYFSHLDYGNFPMFLALDNLIRVLVGEECVTLSIIEI